MKNASFPDYRTFLYNRIYWPWHLSAFHSFQKKHVLSSANGKIKEPVRGAMLIGNGPKILNEIDMLGTDLHFITGTCGKGDHAPVTDAMPTIRIPEIVVGGRN